MQLWQIQKMPNLYANMWKIIVQLLINVPTLYLFQAGFSAANHIPTKKRNALNIFERGSVRLMLTKIKPNILDVISKHQPQGSH